MKLAFAGFALIVAMSALVVGTLWEVPDFETD